MSDKKTFIYKIIVVLIFLLGIFSRTAFLVNNNILSDDECRLALAMFDKSIFAMFLPLSAIQSAPPIFMVFSKIFANISDYNEYFLKFIPYISGIGALFVFYKLCKNYYENKASIAIALFLFAVNSNLILYSTTFKQYSIDIFIGLLCIYFFSKINIADISKTRLIKLSAVISILPFISLASLFFVLPFFIINIFQNFKNKDFYKKFAGMIIPFVVLFTIYYIYNLYPSSVNMKQVFGQEWAEGFWINISGLLKLLIINVRYYIYPNLFVLLPLLLFIAGFITAIFDKTNSKNINRIIFSAFITVFAVSFFKIFPFLGRVTLFLAPLFILLCIKPFDILYNGKKLLLAFVCIFLTGGFINYFFPAYYSGFFNKNTIIYSPNYLMKIMKTKFDRNTDVILFNSASTPSYLFYSYKNRFEPLYYIEIPPDKDMKASIYGYLNSLNVKKGYWFYLVKEYPSAPERHYVQDWLKQQKTDFKIKDKDSYLYYIKPDTVKKVVK